MNRSKRIYSSKTLSLRTAGIALFLGLTAVAPAAFSDEANLTRFGPETYEPVQGKPTTYSSAKSMAAML